MAYVAGVQNFEPLRLSQVHLIFIAHQYLDVFNFAPVTMSVRVQNFEPLQHFGPLHF